MGLIFQITKLLTSAEDLKFSIGISEAIRRSNELRITIDLRFSQRALMIAAGLFPCFVYPLRRITMMTSSRASASKTPCIGHRPHPYLSPPRRRASSILWVVRVCAYAHTVWFLHIGGPSTCPRPIHSSQSETTT